MALHQPQHSSFESLNDNHDYSDDDPDHDEVSEDISQGPSTNGDCQKPQPYSDQKHLSNGHRKGNKKRPTHFLCFPLVTDSSVPQLSQSLSKFREITSTPLPNTGVRRDEIETPERDDDDGSSTQVTTTNGVEHQHEQDKLRLIPQSAHRPAGTFHLTIGTMDLSEKSEMERALRVLKGVDYTSLLRKVDVRLLGSANIRATNSQQREIALDATNPAKSPSSPSDSTVKGSIGSHPNGNGIEHTSGNMYGVNGYRETVSRIDRAILHATPGGSGAATSNGEIHHTTASSSTKTNTPSSGTPTPTASPKITPTAPQTSFQQQPRPAPTSAKPLTSRLFRPSVQLPSSETINSAGNILGISGYKETVSSVDRYVDKTYDAAAKARKAAARKEREQERRDVKGRERGLSFKDRILNRGGRSPSGNVQGEPQSLHRGVSPPASVSTARRRLLDDDASMATGDAESLYTVTSNSTRTPRASIAVGTSAGAPLPLTSTAQDTFTPAAQAQASPPEFTVTLCGLGVFPNPHNARVFYAPPLDADRRLHAFAAEIARVFVQEGLVSEEARGLTLHATVANLRYASNARGGSGGGRGGRGGRGKFGKEGKGERVNASGILEFFNSNSNSKSHSSFENGQSGDAAKAPASEECGFVWAEGIQVDRVRICKMGAEKSDDEVLGMIYPAVEIEVEGQPSKGKERAEVIFA